MTAIITTKTGAIYGLQTQGQETQMTTIKFKTRYCNEAGAVIRKGRYHDGSLALRVYGEIPHEGCVFIKDSIEEFQRVWRRPVKPAKLFPTVEAE